MSIASAPEDEDELEFYIRKVGTPESDLPLTHVMWDIKVGDRMYCRAAATGKFTLEDTCGADDPRLKVMVAAGTGMAPFICIARSRVRKDPDADLGDLGILHGASYPTSLGYREECEQLARDNGLKYLPTVSRPQEVPGWKGFEGRAEAMVGANLARTEEALGLGAGGMTPDKAVVLIPARARVRPGQQAPAPCARGTRGSAVVGVLGAVRHDARHRRQGRGARGSPQEDAARRAGTPGRKFVAGSRLLVFRPGVHRCLSSGGIPASSYELRA
jgi:hypothetical protein